MTDSWAIQIGDGAGEEGYPNPHPEREYTRHPEAYIDAIVPIAQKPEANAGDEAGERGEKKIVIDFLKHVFIRLRGSSG